MTEQSSQVSESSGSERKGRKLAENIVRCIMLKFNDDLNDSDVSVEHMDKIWGDDWNEEDVPIDCLMREISKQFKAASCG